MLNYKQKENIFIILKYNNINTILLKTKNKFFARKKFYKHTQHCFEGVN